MVAVLSRLDRYIPLTNLGAVIALVSAWLLYAYALPRSDYVAQALCAVIISFVIIGSFSATLGTLILRRKYSEGDGARENVRFEAVRGYVRGRTYPKIWWLPWVDVNVESLTRGLVIELEDQTERIEATHRLVSANMHRRIVVEDLFGLSQLSFYKQEGTDVQISPWVGEISDDSAFEAIVQGDVVSWPGGKPLGDRVEMRAYSSGDPIRLILWKLYARTGEVLVRTQESSVEQDIELQAYLVLGDQDEASAAAAWVVLSGILSRIKWRFGCDLDSKGTTDLLEAQRLICASRLESLKAVDRPAGAVGLDDFLSGAKLKAQPVLLFVPASSNDWLDKVTSVIQNTESTVTCLVAFDSDGRGGIEQKSLTALENTVKKLKSVSCPVICIDRVTGKVSDTYPNLRKS